jgi:hypothetical protein
VSPQAERVRPAVRAATAGTASRRREEVFTSVCSWFLDVEDTCDVREHRWTGMAATVNQG